MKFEMPTARYLYNTVLRQGLLNMGYLHITVVVRYQAPENPLGMTIHYFPGLVMKLQPNPGIVLKSLLYHVATGNDPDAIGNYESQMKGYVDDIGWYGVFMK